MSGEGVVHGLIKGLQDSVWEEVGLRKAVGMTSHTLSNQTGDVFHDYVLMYRSPSHPQKTKVINQPKGSPQKFNIKRVVSNDAPSVLSRLPGQWPDLQLASAMKGRKKSAPAGKLTKLKPDSERDPQIDELRRRLINKQREKTRQKVEEMMEQARQEDLQRQKSKWQNCRTVTFDYAGKAVRFNQEKMSNVKCMRLKSNTKVMSKSLHVDNGNRVRTRSKTEGVVAQNVTKIRKVNGEAETQGLFVTQRKDLTVNQSKSHIQSKIGDNLSAGVSITDLNTHTRHNGASRDNQPMAASHFHSYAIEPSQLPSNRTKPISAHSHSQTESRYVPSRLSKAHRRQQIGRIRVSNYSALNSKLLPK